MANAPPNQKDNGKKPAGKDEEVKHYLQPLFENLTKEARQPPDYAKLMAWAVCVALLTLVALPLGSLWISSNSICCFDNNALSDQLTFWAAMLGGFIALFGIVISGLFVVFAFRIDYGATLEASRHAVKAAIEFLEFDPDKILKKFTGRISEFSSLIKKKEDEISSLIKEKKREIEKKAKEIEQPLADIKDKLDQANQEADAKNQQLIEIQGMIEGLIADLKERSESATQNIEALVANVQKAADEAARKLQSETPGDGQEPRS